MFSGFGHSQNVIENFTGIHPQGLADKDELDHV